MSDVFVSYKAEDRARVRPLVEALEADGLSVWWDAQVGGGEEWRDSIQQHLDESKCVIVIWSKRSIGPDGHFVRDEASRAQRRHAYLPVRIDKVDPPIGFGETQAIPITGWKGNRSDPRYQAVLAAARAIISGGPRPHQAHAEPVGINRRMAMAGGAGAIAAAAVGGWFLLKPSAAKANSIAVLPFANLSGDPAQAYFSDGLAEELRSALSRIAGLKVVARTSSEMLRDADVKTVAQRLVVANVLTGSVRRSTSMIRVNAQLVDGDNGMERWSDTFDRPAGDVLEIQTSIAQNVAQALSLHLAGNDILSLGGTRNADALDLYLRSSPERLNDSKAGLQEALRLLESAIELDPNFAQAHARMAFVLFFLAGVYEGPELYGQALASANRAIALAPQLASGYANRGLILRNQLDMGAAFAEFEKAEALPGDDAHVLRVHATSLSRIRRPEKARLMIDRAKVLDPLNPISMEAEALVLYNARNYAEAVTSARRALQIAPDRVEARRYLANALLMLGKSTEAEAEYHQFEPNDYRRLVGEAALAARAGNRNLAMAKLRAMEQRYGEALNYQYAQIYAQLGMVEQGISALRLALGTRDSGLISIRVDPFIDPLRKDPRLVEIERKLNFPI